MTGNNTTANATHAANGSALGDRTNIRTNIDARLKLLYLIVCNVLVMGLNTRSTLWPIIICLGILIACDMSRKFFLGYLAIILISFGATLLPGVPGMNNWLGVALGIVGYWVLRFTVSLSVAIWMFSTTRISEFTTAFHQMRLPNMIVIPLSVMFRFFPVVIDEMRGIVEAMKLRGYQKPWLHPIRTAEYIVVPLLSAVARIADELAAAALIRGLGAPGRPTQLSTHRFGVWDAVMVLAILGFIGLTIAQRS